MALLGQTHFRFLCYRTPGPGSTLRQNAAHAATLIAGLELARDGGITLNQDAPWQQIHIA